jgi:hypothetical protein
MAPTERLSKEEWAERTAAKVAQAQATLATEVAALQSGEDWKNYLVFQARLHAYSPNNVMLIAAQHAVAYEEGRVPEPLPTYVAGFNTWRSLGRSVEKGQHGYAVLAPCRYDRRVAVDPDGNTRKLTTDEAPAPGETVDSRKVLAASESRPCSTCPRRPAPKYRSRPDPSFSKVRHPTASARPLWRRSRSKGFVWTPCRMRPPLVAPTAEPMAVKGSCSFGRTWTKRRW